MKKIMGLVLGLSLAVGAFSFVFAQDGQTTTKKGGKNTSTKKGKNTNKKTS